MAGHIGWCGCRWLGFRRPPRGSLAVLGLSLAEDAELGQLSSTSLILLLGLEDWLGHILLTAKTEARRPLETRRLPRSVSQQSRELAPHHCHLILLAEVGHMAELKIEQKG